MVKINLFVFSVLLSFSNFNGIGQEFFFFVDKVVTFYMTIVIFVFSVFLATLSMVLSSFLASNRLKFSDSLYECGFTPFYFNPVGGFNFQCFRVILTFLIFDLEVLFLFPIVVSVKFFLLSGFFFIIFAILPIMWFLMLGVYYEYLTNIIVWD